MKKLFYFILALTFISNLDAENINPDSLSSNDVHLISSYSLPDSLIEKFPFKNQNNINRFFPGVVSYFQNFYIRGGESYETGYFIDGMKFNNLFSGENSFFINPNVFEKIDYYNGFIPNEFGNTSAGLFNYKLKTGGEKLEFNVEHQSDNFTFTNDAFSGKKRLGTYYYGYNETNLDFGGPLYFNNVRFFANVNYLFQRDKNPQRYPGVNNLSFYDPGSLDSITINLPAGIVPYNSFESFNLLSTLLFDFDKIKIKASGIYFDENEFTEREHLLQYLNPRLGLIDRSGGIVNLKFEHKINDIFSYSINGNYYQKNEMTTDQYLGENYWAYGDSVANAEAGIIWQNGNWISGRYIAPSPKGIFIWGFQASGFPSIGYKKSEQTKFSFSGNFKIDLISHQINIGGEFTQHKIRNWQLANQIRLAGRFADARINPNFDNLNDQELKDLIAAYAGVNNFGYSPSGNLSNSGLYETPEPVFNALYINDQFHFLDKFYLYLGLRYDHFDFGYKKMIDPAAPEKTYNYNTGIIKEDGLIKTNNYSFLSPKVYFKFLLLNNLSFAANYSQNIQSHPFSEIYEGYYSTVYRLYSLDITPLRIKELKPIQSFITEFGITYKPVNNLNTVLKYYNKKIKNHLSLEYMKTISLSPFRPYYYEGNNGLVDIWGLEFQLDYYLENIFIRTIINYQKADELVNLPYQIITSEGQLISNTKIVPERINKIGLNSLVNYNFSNLSNISTIFDKLNLSLLFAFNSGHPYYYQYSAYLRPPSGSYSGTTPNVYQLDLKIEKGFSVLSNLNLDFYIYVINLLDAKNVYDVFPRTGSAEDDGYLSDPNLGGQLVEIYGEQFVTLYNLINQYNPLGGQQTFFGPPRQIGFGIKLNY